MKEPDINYPKVLTVDDETNVGIYIPRNPGPTEHKMMIWNPGGGKINPSDIDRGLYSLVDVETGKKCFDDFQAERRCEEVERDQPIVEDTVIAVKFIERGTSLERVYEHRDGTISEMSTVDLEVINRTSANIGVNNYDGEAKRD